MEVFKIFKKFLYTSFAALVFFTISNEKASAAEYDFSKGLLDENPSIIESSDLDPLIFDNDINTGIKSENTYTIVFKDVMPLNQYVLKVKADSLYRMYLYDSSGVLIKSVTTRDTSPPVAYDGNYLFVEASDVKKITFNGMSFDESEKYEFDIFPVPDEIPPSKISNVQYVFNEDNSITYTFDFPTDTDFSHLEIYQGSSLLNEKFTNNSIKITDLVPLMNYSFKFISVDKSGNKSDPYESIITMPEGPDLIPPLEISNLKHIVYDTSVQFTYSLPIDDDFSHIQVWRGNEQIADNVRINSFKDENLDYETSYNYVFKTVDFSGNVSNGSSLTIKTMPFKDDIPPLAPVGLEVITGNSSLSFSWIPSPENDVLGYNVYVDDVKINGSVISGNSYRLTNLTNGNEYKIQVSAVDTSGNESELSNLVVAVPDESKLPVFKVDTDLKSVAESTENWFSELWLVLAFSSSIPIAFLVGHRIKNLFFA